MKTTMKTTMKTILSIFMVTVLFYACDTGTNLPAPLNLDCNGIENGLAVADECGTCHQSYIYDVGPNSNHIPTYINDTTGLELGATEIVIIAGSPEDIASNPNWNASCTDCSGFLNGTAIIDDCEDCHKWLAYNDVTHATREVNDTITEVLGANEMFASPNNPMNPLWNAGCK